MTTSAQLGVARQSVQLRINQTKPRVNNLENLVAGGAVWNQIDNEWNSINNALNSQASELDNLQKQNAGLNNDPGQKRLTTLITKNQVEVTTMQTTMNGIRTQAFRNTESVELRATVVKDSAGEIIKREQIGSVETSRFTSPVVGNNDIFKRDLSTETSGIEPFLQSSVKPTNARISQLSLQNEEELGDLKGSGSTSTVGGDATVRKVTEVQTNALNDTTTVTRDDVQVALPDDASAQNRNSSANAINADGVEGRTAVAAEFEEAIVASPNPLQGLASQTYAASIYMMNQDEYIKFLYTDRKTLPTQQLILQSGGAKPEERNKFFNLDFYIENIEFESIMGTQETMSPHNVAKLSFDIMEPQGITFLDRLANAITEHERMPDVNVYSQNFLMVIRFYGYDEFGNLVTKRDLPAGEVETTSDPEALVEKFIPFQFANITYRINNKAVVYNVTATTPQMQVGFSTARATIPFNFQLSASSVNKLLNGNSELVPLVPIVTTTTTSGLSGGPPNQNRVTTTTTEETVTVEQQRAGKHGLVDRTVTSGLADALNQHQRELVKIDAQKVADEYIIIIEDVPGLIDAKMRKQGTVNKARAPMQMSQNPNEQKNMEKNFLDTETKEYSVSAGTQIVQLIDQIMKNSTYITAQQTIAFDEITNKEIVNKPVKTVQWYRITQTAVPTEYDSKRNDFGYQITYRISRYQINTPRSPYFPPAMYRGAHKIYNYWFTGLNTEVLNFEIQANANYLTIIGNDGLTQDQPTGSGARYAEKRFFQSSPEESTQGGARDSTRPAAQLASRLYAPVDVARSTIEIVGDPDFIQQSELFYNTPNLRAFEPDGSVNSSAGEVLYEVRFNKVTDYDMTTGITPVNANNSDSKITGEKNLAQFAEVYCTQSVVNYFKDGKFTQRLMGTVRNFELATDSPKQEQIQKNVIEEAPGLDAFGGEGESIRPSQNVIPPGARSSNQQFQPTAGQDPRAGNFKTAKTIDGSKVNRQKKEPYSSAVVNNATTSRIAKLPDNSVDYTDNDFPEGTLPKAPLVKPKPGSNTVSDDAGTKTSPMQESLFAKRRREARAKAEAARARGAKVVGNKGGGVSSSSAFR